MFHYSAKMQFAVPAVFIIKNTDYGHPDRAFFWKSETFGLGQTNWAENIGGIWGIFGQTTAPNLAEWVPCPSESVRGCFFYKKLRFLGLKHTTPKCSQNKILAGKNLGKCLHTSVFGGSMYVRMYVCIQRPIQKFRKLIITEGKKFLFTVSYLKFRYSEKATKICKNLPLFLMLLSNLKESGRFLHILWPYHNIWTLLDTY